MKKLLIIKAGSTFNSIKKVYGDFEDFIINQLEINYNDVIVTDVINGEPLPGYNEISGIIITGSHSMVTDKEKWSENLAQWLKKLRDHDIPALGICYGHQLLAYAFGGEVDYHPEGKEFGIIDVNLTENSTNDELFRGFPETFTSYGAHSQTVIKLPPGAVLLAENSFEKHHAFSLGRNIWGIQFHPEFNAGITKMYIEKLRDELTREGLDPDQLIESVEESPYGKLLLKNFYNLMK